MTWLIQVWAKYAPFFNNYILPFFGLGIILWGVYLIQYVMKGKE